MSLSHCRECKYLDRNPNHSGDIICGLNPAYASMWKRLQSLDDYSLNCLPIDHCREFELDPSFLKKEISISLSFSQWQQISRKNIPSLFLEQLQKQTIHFSASLTIQQWQDLAFYSDSLELVQQLSNQDIDVSFDGYWISVDSSCINAIAYNSSTNELKIRFNSGAIYQYENFDSLSFSDFRNAASHGQYFNNNIKDCYPFSQLR